MLAIELLKKNQMAIILVNVIAKKYCDPVKQQNALWFTASIAWISSPSEELLFELFFLQSTTTLTSVPFSNKFIIAGIISGFMFDVFKPSIVQKLFYLEP